MACQPLVTFAWTLLVLAMSESAGAIPYTRNTRELPMMVPDKETGARVAKWTKEMNVNPEELGSYFEGDIMITRNTKRNGATDESLRWPNCVVPYEINGDFDDNQMALIQAAMDDYSQSTCIKFVPRTARTDEEDYVSITSEDTGCHSNIGRIGGEQIVNLQIPGCVIKKGTVIHELMHAIGFWHEHTREERDDYVDINWDNIQEEATGNFVKVSPGQTTAFGVPYDYGSVMHYTAYAFAKDDSQKTIITKDPNAEIGQREGFSDSDIKKINTMYQSA
ncbi:PREDICTED: zinc metalloproteinase nas-7-like [Wasmannia auropunctata]|uniref:zinc metalloproteinase nas-7-like n=1 Tax=Wasmannia auropunctata TaxID=64793 RepID=UPI0005EF47B0|nr:PREDICTED: zinc metalloproteinase nas-7-like [Wasmannia auropunctata]